jgi:magnesium transporter
VDYLRSPLGVLFRTRVIWLALLTLFGVFVSTYVAQQEEILERVIVLAAFIAPIIDMGGNTGSQAATLVIRSLALGQVRPRLRDYLLILRREVPVALSLGIVIGLLEAVLAFFSKGVGWDILLVVGLAMTTVTILGGLIGSALPFLARRFGVDPATLSGPAITSIMDLLGVFVYFGYARLLLGHLLE